MGRVSRAQAEENRQQVVSAASHLFRELGANNVSVADLMKAAGLTHGGFYKQFASKEALQAEATEQGFADHGGSLAAFDARCGGDHHAAREALIGDYLSAGHRDDPGGGCPTAGFAADMARLPGSAPARERYVDGVERFADWLALQSGDPQEALATLSTLVGALLLARATAGSPLSDAILAAAREACGVPSG